jgi:CheY-like chemotaxis protein
MFDFAAQRDLPTVLLIDDDLVSREVMATVLTLDGFTVHTAVDGPAALDLLAAASFVPGVILMDAQMPGMSGAHLIQQLRWCSQASLYVISASEPPSEVMDAADGFLLKPFNPDSFRSLLQKHEPQAPSAVEDSSAGPVVDPETLAQLRERMPEAAVRQIYAAVVADLFKRLSALELAVAKEDQAEIRRIGHSIKGGCGMAGAIEAAKIGAALEAGVDQLDNNSTHLIELRAAARHLRSMLKTEFPE